MCNSEAVTSQHSTPQDSAPPVSSTSQAGRTITVSALVVRHPDEAKILMVRKRGTSALMLPGGKPDGQEDARATIVREIAEELGLDIDTPHLDFLGTYTAQAANEAGFSVVGHVFTYRGVPAGLDINAPSVHQEIAEAIWVGIDPLPADTASMTIAPLTRNQVVPNLPEWMTEKSQPPSAHTAPAFAQAPVKAAEKRVLALTRRSAATGKKALGVGKQAVGAGKRAADLSVKAAGVGKRLVASRLSERQVGPIFAPKGSDRFTVGVYFAGDQASVYQLQQWLWPLTQLRDHLRAQGQAPGVVGTKVGPELSVLPAAQLPATHAEPSDEPVGILCRDARNAQLIAGMTDVPVRFARLTKGLDVFMSNPQLACVLYVNQATMNFQGLRYPRPAHVHLSHGESEKISMISNQLKAYDHVFTAGQAARDRLSATLYGFHVENCMDVGRPQLDEPAPVPAQALSALGAGTGNAQSPIVFYAPTWEGDSEAMAYGTLGENGVRLVRGFIEAGLRVIVRPHPRTGFVQPAFRTELEKIRQVARTSAGVFYDETPQVGWQFHVADVCVAEMSSVAFDWLTTRKPLVMIKPTNTGAELLPGGLFDRAPSVAGADPAGIVREVLTGLARHTATDVEATSEYYLGNTQPGAQVGRFMGAVDAVVQQRQREWEN